MGLEVKAGSALALGRLGLGLGKGFAYTAGGTIAGMSLGTVLMITAGSLILGCLIGSAMKATKEAEN